MKDNEANIRNAYLISARQTFQDGSRASPQVGLSSTVQLALLITHLLS